jgi:uncharacterized protein (DUF924 family)
MSSSHDSAARPHSLAAATRESFVQLESYAGRGLPRVGFGSDPAPDPVSAPSTPADALAVIDFWRAAGPELWFAKDDGFDRRFRDRFLPLYQAASQGELADWPATAYGALALLLLLDQFPRNAFRGTPRMYATDAMARDVAAAALDAGHDRVPETELQVFFYLPFGHSETLADQDRSVELNRRLGEPDASHAEGHRDIVRRFGRFPHRNPILGRMMTEAEQRFLDAGGYAG